MFFYGTPIYDTLIIKVTYLILKINHEREFFTIPHN